jgi:hypothetical protein
MGFRLRIVEGPGARSAVAPLPVGVVGEDAIIDLYLRALHTARPTPGSLEFEQLERAFERVARSFSKRAGISYAAWRDVDVPAATLDAAGIRQEATTQVSPEYGRRRLAAVLAPTLLRHATRHIRYRDFRQTSWRSSRRQLPSP